MRDVMVDIETLGQRPGAVILSIGAVAFDTVRMEIGPTFYTALGVGSALKAGAGVDHATLEWWRKQQPAALAAVFDALAPGAPDQFAALIAFEDFLASVGAPEHLRIWGNGANFDNALLAAAFGQVNRIVPWRFWNDRCFRTLKSLFPGHEPDRAGVHHNALDDALHQARWALAIAAARSAF